MMYVMYVCDAQSVGLGAFICIICVNQARPPTNSCPSRPKLCVPLSEDMVARAMEDMVARAMETCFYNVLLETTLVDCTHRV